MSDTEQEWRFSRYRYGKLMAEGVCITQQSTLNAAIKAAAYLTDGAEVLVYSEVESLQAEAARLREERDRYKELAECICGEPCEYPAHGWMSNLCPACQADYSHEMGREES